MSKLQQNDTFIFLNFSVCWQVDDEIHTLTFLTFIQLFMNLDIKFFNPQIYCILNFKFNKTFFQKLEYLCICFVLKFLNEVYHSKVWTVLKPQSELDCCLLNKGIYSFRTVICCNIDPVMYCVCYTLQILKQECPSTWYRYAAFESAKLSL